MTSAHDFMIAFAKAIIHNVDTRPQIIQQWTEKLEAREAELGRGFYERLEKEINLAGITFRPGDTGSRVIEAAKKVAGLI